MTDQSSTINTASPSESELSVRLESTQAQLKELRDLARKATNETLVYDMEDGTGLFIRTRPQSNVDYVLEMGRAKSLSMLQQVGLSRLPYNQVIGDLISVELDPEQWTLNEVAVKNSENIVKLSPDATNNDFSLETVEKNTTTYDIPTIQANMKVFGQQQATAKAELNSVINVVLAPYLSTFGSKKE